MFLYVDTMNMSVEVLRGLLYLSQHALKETICLASVACIKLYV